MKFEKRIVRGLTLAREHLKVAHNEIVYMLTNYDTSIQEDLYRKDKIAELGYVPDVRIYRKNSLPRRHILKDMQRWCNNRFVYRSCAFEDYVPRSDGRKIKEIYKEYFK